MQTIRLRALLTGLCIGVFLCGITPFADSYLKSTPLAGGHFPLAASFVFFVAIILLALIARIRHRTPLFSGTELLVCWVLAVLVSGIGFTGLVRTFFLNITIPAQFADATNNYQDTLLPLLPEPLYPRDPQLLRQLYNGLPDKVNLGFFEIVNQIPWSIWLPILGAWTVFILLAYATLFFLASLFTNQWVVNERINFPLLQVPRLLAEAYDEQRLFSFLANPYLLCGLTIPLLIHTLGGLSAHFPSVPTFSTEILAGSYFPANGLLSGYQKLRIFIYPAFIGFAFIATRQVSLSFWLFFLLAGLFAGLLQSTGLQIPATSLGTLFGPTISSPEETQVIGASIIFFAFMIWLARDYLGSVIRQCIHPAEQEMEAGWVPARYAMLGAILCYLLLCIWSAYWGMGLGTSALLYLCFFAAMLITAKVVCQGGIPYCTFNTAPADSILSLFGSRPLGTIGLIMGMSIQKMLFVDIRESLLPSLVHTGKITEKLQQRKLLALTIAASLVLAVVVSFASMLYLCYRYGLQDLDMDWATRTTQTVYTNADRLLSMGQTPNPYILGFIIFGALAMAGLILCYYIFPWWPIHPIGYLMAYSSSMRILWFSCLIGWLCNSLCLRYGGTHLYRKLRLFFIGLILGDFCMGAFWALVSLRTGVSYLVLPF